MDYEAELLQEARKAIAQCPDHRCEIIELYRLAVGEIECGESAANEYELFVGSVNVIRKETTNGE
jgi:hypothetical protein